MPNVQIPKAIPINKLVSSNYSLSPNNYRLVSVKNPNLKPLRYYLNETTPYSQGIEPGSVAYVNRSRVGFLRNSCINKYNLGWLPSKIIHLNPRYEIPNMINPFDVLLCKDANIGDACLFIDNGTGVYLHSSGVVRLNFQSDDFKFYCLAFMKDEYFLEQLDSMTPRGSTIRHAGERFMDCLVPLPRPGAEWVFPAIQCLCKNIGYSEYWCHRKTSQTVELIDEELMVNEIAYSYPSIEKIIASKRLDAAFYSPELNELFQNVKKYPRGCCSLQEYGFTLRRGPNLAKRDLGRSIQSSKYKKNFNVLIYPSDISDAGYIFKSSYIGARAPIWFLEIGNILFAAEGTVGKTFTVCNKSMRFTTNFHGTIIYPVDRNNPIEKSIFLGQFLSYLRLKEFFGKMAVGGQGGSFAIGYWNTIRIPNFSDEVVSKIAHLYHSSLTSETEQTREAVHQLEPLVFDIKKIEEAGIFELNEFRILCGSMLDVMRSDIKAGELKLRSDYEEYAKSAMEVHY
jgi:hypothetical protein